MTENSTTPTKQESRQEFLRTVFRGTLFLVALVLLAIAIVGQQTPLAKGLAAPELKLYSYEDEHAWKLRDEYQGRPVVVNFWGTWCPPCLAEMPHFASTYRDLGEKIPFLGASVNSPKWQVDRIRKKLDIPYTLALVDSESVKTWNAQTVPSTFLLNADHQVVWSITGQISEVKLKEVIQEYLTP